MTDAEFDRWVQKQGGQSVSKELWEKLAKSGIFPELPPPGAKTHEAVRRDDELTAGVVVGREHGEVMRAARQRLGCA